LYRFVGHGFYKVVCRCEADVFCPPKQSPRGLGDCSPALAAGASVTAFGGSQRHNNLGFSMDFVKATFRWNVPLAIFSDSGKIAQRYRKIGLIQVK
jgi:hypothetical protein